MVGISFFFHFTVEICPPPPAARSFGLHVADKQRVDYTNVTAFPLSFPDKLQPATGAALADSRRLVLNCRLFLQPRKQGHESSYSAEIENAQAQCTQGNCNLALRLSRLLPVTATLHCTAVLQSSRGAGPTGWGRSRPPSTTDSLEPNRRASLEVILYIVFRFYRAAFDKEKTDVLLRCVQHDSFMKRKEKPKGYSGSYQSHPVLQFGTSGGRKESSHFHRPWSSQKSCAGLINWVNFS